MHLAFYILLHPFTVQVFPVLWASLFTWCGRCRYEVCHFSISSRATCSCWSVCRGIAVATQRATAMVGGRFVGFGRFPRSRNKEQTRQFDCPTMFQQVLNFQFLQRRLLNLYSFGSGFQQELPLRDDGALIAAYWQRRPLRLLQRCLIGLICLTGSYWIHFIDLAHPVIAPRTEPNTSTLRVYCW